MNEEEKVNDKSNKAQDENVVNEKNTNNNAVKENNANAEISNNVMDENNKAVNNQKQEKTRFKYICYDKNGKTVKGYFDSYRKLDVESFLNAQGYKILQITPTKISKFSFSKFSRAMKYKDLVFILTQLSTYIKSGIPLADAINILGEQTRSKHNRELFKKIAYELNTGAQFSQALERQGNTFPKLLINMLKTSELTGNLTEALDDMASYYKTADTNRKQIISALMYPSVVLVVAVIVLVFLLIFIIPKFQDIFDQLGTDLPKITMFLINASDFVTNNIIYIVLGLGVFAIVFSFIYKRVRKVRYSIQWLLMHIPVIKDVLIDKEVVMFTKTFASLIKHDVFIADSIEMLGRVTNNEIYKDIIKEAITNLSNGSGLSKAFDGKWAFPRIAYEMLVTGEKTGRLGLMMENVANHFEEEQKNLVQRLKSLIEPVMIILLAAIIGVVLLAIFVPMFKMYTDVI